MEYNTFRTVVECEFEKFLFDYKMSTKLFENTDVKNNLLHAGEYGMYKENLLGRLLKFILPAKYAIGTGFIINQNKQTTTQCDIVVYDYNNTPFNLGGHLNRFYPQESVLAIGEVKSKLRKKELGDALIKLAENKAIRHGFEGITSNGDSINVQPAKNAYNHIFSFLICNEIQSYEAHEICEYIEQRYVAASIPVHNRHNAIISLKDGLILYKSNAAMAKKLNSKNPLFVPFPCYYNTESKETENLEKYIYVGDEMNIIKQFSIHLNNFFRNSNAYYPEPNNYIL